MRKHITFASIPLLTFVLCGGCGDVWLEPDPPSNVDAGPPPPPDAPPPRPSLPMEDNLPRDAYDATNHRLLLGDCVNDTLVALDLVTGERDVLIDTWPWTEPDSTACVQEVVVNRDGRRAFAIVRRRIPDPDPRKPACSSTDLVDIDLETREVAEIENIDYECCDEFCGYRGYSAPQLDEYRSRLLVLEKDVVADYSTGQLTSLPLGAGPEAQRYGMSPDCHPDDGEECEGELWPEYEAFTLDPSTPNEHALLITWEYSIPNSLDGQFMIDKYDIVNGTRVSRQPVQLFDDPAEGYLTGASIDIDMQRLLLTWGKGDQWLVAAVDLVTGEETLLYDGSPASGGARLRCRPQTAFDSRERYLLLVERSADDPAECTGVFAVDADTGAFYRLDEITW